MTKRERNKLDQLNIPELFYDRFVANIPRGQESVVDKLHDTEPTKRGRGLTRVLRNITETEWNVVYQLAATGRAAMKKKGVTGDVSRHREDTLFPAICAKTLAERMEAAGVANPVPYTPKKTGRRTKAEIEAARKAEEQEYVMIADVVTQTDDTEATEATGVPSDPPVLERVSIPESTPSEQEAFRRDMNLGN